MPKIFRPAQLELMDRPSLITDFLWKRTGHLGESANAKYLHFDIMILPPDKFSYPYHSHRNAEELFYIIDGEVTLRSPEGYQTLIQGDIIFFEEGAEGAHQLYNHTNADVVYLDIRTKANIDVCDYPDSGKINVLPTSDIFQSESKVTYFTGEEEVREKWPTALVKKHMSGPR
jgi:uncharacterized cupin superfamily protein